MLFTPILSIVVFIFTFFTAVYGSPLAARPGTLMGRSYTEHGHDTVSQDIIPPVEDLKRGKRFHLRLKRFRTHQVKIRAEALTLEENTPPTSFPVPDGQNNGRSLLHDVD
ncbi:hypothetical protein BDQ17DRAFT_1073052 [Cyathus striatus]|nr:hypothetical protein BDQ17DRAFT_1073052 [Cyathus striatus]